MNQHPSKTRNASEVQSHREDLIREATALRRRARLLVPGCEEPVVAGFRSQGQLSLFFGEDPVYQFDEEHRLRRAFVAGFLFRTQGSTLARLERTREAGKTVLLRHDLTPSQLAQFLSRMQRELGEFNEQLEHVDDVVQIADCIPAGDDIRRDIITSLRQILQMTDSERLAPPIKTRRS